MKRLAFVLLILVSITACNSHRSTTRSFITVREGKFYQGDKPYRYIGANFWYGAILGSEGQGGNRQRLCQELDSLQALGITNLRILVGAEGLTNATDHIQPTLQPQPSEYNDTLLQGLDYLMAEMGKRNMQAILYLHNAWQWSGGFGIYLKWAGMGEPAPASNWQAYTQHHSQFHNNAKARELALKHTQFIVSRTNSITGKPYADDPTLMAWELCNEPRPFASDSLTKAGYFDWIRQQAEAIKQIDPNHLVTTGSEGRFGSEMDMQLYERVHALPAIDYLCIHIWPYNWGWLGRFASTRSEALRVNGQNAVSEHMEEACSNTADYIAEHMDIAKRLQKPLVLEEFGYPRDAFEIALGTPVTARDRYYQFVLSQIGPSGLAGINFWAWGGNAKPVHDSWQPWDPYTGDPAQEEQGLYSVFQSDATTLSIIREAVKKLRLSVPHP